eukprot:7099156-Pyramimonas_sp.AAC.1
MYRSTDDASNGSALLTCGSWARLHMTRADIASHVSYLERNAQETPSGAPFKHTWAVREKSRWHPASCNTRP